MIPFDLYDRTPARTRELKRAYDQMVAAWGAMPGRTLADWERLSVAFERLVGTVIRLEPGTFERERIAFEQTLEEVTRCPGR
jgi:hypothetical protein